MRLRLGYRILRISSERQRSIESLVGRRNLIELVQVEALAKEIASRRTRR